MSNKPRFNVSSKRANAYIALAVVAIIVVCGCLLVATHAATFFASVNPTQGTVATNAKVVTDSSALDGKSIQFNAPASGGGGGTTSPTPSGVTGTWTMKFDDEFVGSSLDTSKWHTGWLASGITPPTNSEELQCYDPAQVSVSGGYLNLTATSKQETCGGTTRQYASGMVNSYGSYSFTYGFMEAKMYLPGSGGHIYNWPAWWADGAGLNWPTGGELDAMEGLGGSACYHFHSPSGGPGGCASGDYTGWHTYGADWQNGSVTFYYDGVKVGKITSGITTTPQFLILNLAVDNTYGGTKSVPSTTQVDYVRVWQ